MVVEGFCFGGDGIGDGCGGCGGANLFRQGGGGGRNFPYGGNLNTFSDTMVCLAVSA